MLSQLEHLSRSTDGRYATDADLQFIADYVLSYELRLRTYTKLREREATIVQDVKGRIDTLHPQLFIRGNEDFTSKWQQDTIRVIRYTAIAMLLNDREALQEKFLFWFQTIMKAFKVQESCNITYQVMQEVVKKHFTPSEASLLCPILELNRNLLGQTPKIRS
ncbi:phycobilisome protein [Neosynechococcus sphagnicola sy1]|uniref:Phycobilisome protein n=1 Tax=Neosynechococcus sphagnicola sy1 TaxID=1497020 RepID=A0A098TJ68_9CYAN|nr:phycobilisome protein [Neosynechococcus sphagnicola]KGF72047.1 phycobilisome protein [Neosynechococcus sphagnicola sy1]